MNEDLAKDYLTKSGFDAMQAHALSKLLADTATKDDLRDLERRLVGKMDGLETRLRAEIVRATALVQSELSQSIAQSRADLSESIAQSRVELTQAIASSQTQTMRWGIAMIVAMSTIFTLLDIFID